MKTFGCLEKVKQNKLEIDDSWSPCDDSLPKGWMFKKRTFGNRSFNTYITERGNKINGLRMVLKFMVENQYPSEALHNVRRSLQNDGWLTHRSLPEDWFYRKFGHKTNFLSSQGEKLTTKETALNYLMKIGFQPDIEKFKKFNDLYL